MRTTHARELRASPVPLHPSTIRQKQRQPHIEALSDTAALHLHVTRESALEESEKRVAPLAVPKDIS